MKVWRLSGKGSPFLWQPLCLGLSIPGDVPRRITNVDQKPRLESYWRVLRYLFLDGYITLKRYYSQNT